MKGLKAAEVELRRSSFSRFGLFEFANKLFEITSSNDTEARVYGVFSAFARDSKRSR